MTLLEPWQFRVVGSDTALLLRNHKIMFSVAFPPPRTVAPYNQSHSPKKITLTAWRWWERDLGLEKGAVPLTTSCQLWPGVMDVSLKTLLIKVSLPGFDRFTILVIWLCATFFFLPLLNFFVSCHKPLEGGGQRFNRHASKGSKNKPTYHWLITL